VTRLAAALALCLLPATALGQQSGERMPPVYRNAPKRATATITGRVLDARTNTPVAGALVAARWPARHGRIPTDSLGRFELDGVEPGPVTVDVNCPSRTMLGPHAFDTTTVADTGRTTTVDLRVTLAACVEPDSGSRRVALRGVYSSGFEESRFVPCREPGAEFSQLWGPRHLRDAWVDFAEVPRGIPRARWPRGAQKEHGYLHWYVEWTGTLTGPGSFGHLGVAPYLFTVDSVSVARSAGPGECQLVESVTIP
jgi:hypothetical protein